MKKPHDVNQTSVSVPPRDVPFIVFDAVPAFAVREGAVHLELAVSIVVPKSGGGVAPAWIEAGRLRCGISAAKNLISILQKAVTSAEMKNSENVIDSIN